MCGKVGPLAKRASGKEPGLCRSCYQKSQSSRKKCGVCGQMRRISRRARDGQPDMCNNCVPKNGRCDLCGKTGTLIRKAKPGVPAVGRCCYRPPERECSRCGRVRPCRYAGTPSPLCLACVQTTRPMVQCVSCQAVRRPYKRIPDGPICRLCYRRQGAATGPCTGCATFSSIANGLCESCTLKQYLQRLCEDGRAEIVAVLGPYLDSLACSERPRSTLMWAEKRCGLLVQLLAGEIAVTHEALDTIPPSAHPPRTIAFIRAGLVHAGVLDERDEVLTAFTKWVQSKLSTVERPSDRALIGAYATWDVARGLSQRTAKTGRPATRHARSLVIEAINLTRWLHAQELTLGDLHQDLLDEWVTAGTSRRRWVRLFVIWLKRNGACGELHVANPQPASQTIPLADLERIEILRSLLANTALDPRDRLAGSLVLLYAQPITRITRLAASDIHAEPEAVAIRLGRGALCAPRTPRRDRARGSPYRRWEPMAVSRAPRGAPPQPRLPQTSTEDTRHHQQLRPPRRAARARDTPTSLNPRRALWLPSSPHRQMGTHRRRRIRRLRRATHDNTLTARPSSRSP
jgi:hypothetical protein